MVGALAGAGASAARTAAGKPLKTLLQSEQQAPRVADVCRIASARNERRRAFCSRFGSALARRSGGQLTRRVPAGIGPTGVPSIRIGPTILRYASPPILWQCPGPQAPRGRRQACQGRRQPRTRDWVCCRRERRQPLCDEAVMPSPWQVTICVGQGPRRRGQHRLASGCRRSAAKECRPAGRRSSRARRPRSGWRRRRGGIDPGGTGRLAGRQPLPSASSGRPRTW